ncbi:uncharacterized protein [Nothobranchius furzeri]|uniref:uncharacterized protein n=1 Tax=Nothobranchius furzeri TaxID=105023 RepID=UPI002404053B|nr:uncharacterized protein LOC129164960 [Nothobranchius furzeri]
MAKRFEPSGKTVNSHPSFGRGRGVMGLTFQPGCAVGFDLGASPILPASSSKPQGLARDPDETPTGQMLFGGQSHSTPVVGNDLHQISDMIYQLGSQIGESIANKLLSSGVAGGKEACGTCQKQDSANVEDASVSDGQRFNVIVKSETSPAVFKGDNSDKYTVTEWVEMMRGYLRRQNYDVSMQKEEIMGKLMGRARDVVKIGLRSNPALNATSSPDVIYNMLIQYFSNTSSCLPLQDFYSTLPLQKEDAVDYWIRLNKAADMAEEGLKRQGKRIEDIGSEIAKMFVKHCPDTELASVFKYKQIHEWTPKDIQERLDEHQRERLSSIKTPMHKPSAAQLLCFETHVEPRVSSNVHMPDGVLLHHVVQPTTEAPLSYAPAMVQNQQFQGDSVTPAAQTCIPSLQPMKQQSKCTEVQCQFQSPASAPLSQPQEGAMLGDIVSMLRELLTKVQPSGQPSYARRGRTKGRARSVMNCRVCNDDNHTTETHCRSDRLCFTCFSPDHTRWSCPTNTSPTENMQGN